VVPRWALSLLVLALIAPVLVASIDALARGRRRGHRASRSLAWVISTAIPFGLALLIILAAHLSGLLSAVPPSPVRGGLEPVGAGALALLIVLALILVGGLVFLRPWLLGVAWRPGGASSSTSTPAAGPGRPQSREIRRGTDAAAPDDELCGRGAVVSLVLCVAVLGIWERNPFAAGLMVPALHCWLWATSPSKRMPRAISALLLVAGLAVPVSAAVYYAATLGLGPVSFAWNAVLLAGGSIGAVSALCSTLVLAATVCAITIALRHTLTRRRAAGPVSLPGSVSYAGPRPLSRRQSALRR
jgi:hypothetical protein